MKAGAFVGRAQEVSLLDRALRDAMEGRVSLVFLAGEPGIGKSCLAEEAAELASRLGMAVGWGRAWDGGGAPAFWPWIQVLRALREVAPDAADAATLARILPELGEAPAHGETPDARFALFDGVLRVLVGASLRRPVLIVLDDLHAADVASLQLLSFVAGHLRGARVALIGTYRGHEVRTSPVADELLARTSRAGQVIDVRPLAMEDVAALAAVGSSFEATLDEATITRVHAVTEGNPLFVTEMLRMLAAGWPADGRAPVPDGVRSIIRERLAALAPERRAVLETAAMIGPEFAEPLLADCCARPRADVAADLAAATDAGLIVERGPGRHGFRHGLFAEALRRGMSAPRRAELHLRIADQLGRVPEGDPHAPLVEIAHHLLEAGSAAAARAVIAAERAARRALRQLAFDQAVALLERALPAAVGVADSVARAELLLLLAHARTLAGDVRGGQDASLDAAAVARALAMPELLAKAALARGAALTIGVTDRVLVELLEEALALLPQDDSPLRARLLARLAAALQPARNPAEPISLARMAIEIVQRVGDERARLEVLHTASASLVKHGAPHERVVIDEEARALAERLGEPMHALRAHARLVFDFVELGDVPSALQHVAAYERLATTIGRPHARWPAPMFRAMFALHEGRFLDHDRHLAEARGWIETTDDELAPLCLEMHHVGTLRVRGDDGALAGVSSTLWRSLPRFALYDRAMTWMILARQERTDALRAALEHHAPAEIIALGDPVIATWTGEAVAAVRDRSWAAALYEWIAARPSQTVLQGMHGMFVDGPLARVLYLLADVLDLADRARAHMEDALAQALRDGARPLQARILYEWGRIACARGLADEGRRSLEAAREQASALGIELAVRIDTALASLQLPSSAVPAGGLTLAREGEYWTVTGEGGIVRVRHSRGLEMLARLVAQPGRELHALELVGAEGTDAGDAGEAIDREARDAYRSRLRELEAELMEAESWNDLGRTERLHAEGEAIRAELARALGLGGSARRVGSAAERARINAQRRLATAISRIEAGHPRLGAHLAGAVRTGTYCVYDPEGRHR